MSHEHSETHSSHDLDIGGARSVIGSDGVNDANDVALHHANVVDVLLLLGHLQEMLDEVHDVGASVHIVLGEKN
ncbi:hypothetical protein Ct61P_05953 [Colletotrichum tofieldiae]|nr:hypothetical protein Ct61P_05953 [Colletotrichum tofieldiae]